MSVSIFRFGRRLGTSVRLPSDYRANRYWQPQVNEAFPDFTAITTRGTIKLKEWARGSWVYLMSHPAAFTPVCSTEIGELAKRTAEFEERNVRVLALTRDTVEQIGAWSRQIEDIYDVRITFPHVADPESVIARACGLVSNEAEWNGRMCVRRTYLIDPDGIIRAIFEYPLAVGRSVDEALRTIDALQVAGQMGAFTPGDWKMGDPVLVGNGESTEGLKKRYGRHLRSLAPFLNFFDIRKPSAPAATDAAPASPASAWQSRGDTAPRVRAVPRPVRAIPMSNLLRLADPAPGRVPAHANVPAFGQLGDEMPKYHNS